MPVLVRLNNGFVTVGTNAPGVSCFDVAGESDADQEPFGDVPIMQCLGLASLPFPPDSSGHAEGVLLEGVGGLPGIVVSAWDTRTFSLFGSLEGGDTVLHSTGPAKAAQVLCKEKKRQVVLATKDMDDEPAMVVLDGKNRKFQVVGWGLTIELSKDNGIVLEAGSARVIVHPDNGVIIQGAVTIGGATPAPPGMSMAVAPLATWTALSALGGPIVAIPNAIGAL
jgi:hypothetical protein